jgi:hypothetical protein
MPLRAAQGESCISFFNGDKLNDEKQLSPFLKGSPEGDGIHFTNSNYMNSESHSFENIPRAIEIYN